jgi:hypothetical protein
MILLDSSISDGFARYLTRLQQKYFVLAEIKEYSKQQVVGKRGFKQVDNGRKNKNIAK